MNAATWSGDGWLHVPGQRTGCWHRALYFMGTDSVTNHTLNHREGCITQSRAKSPVLRKLQLHHSEKNRTRNGAMGGQFNVVLGTVPRHSVHSHQPFSHVFRSGLSHRINHHCGEEGRTIFHILDETALSQKKIKGTRKRNRKKSRKKKGNQGN